MPRSCTYILNMPDKLSKSCSLLQLVGASDVSSARGDAMCAEAIKKLKVNVLLKTAK